MEGSDLVCGPRSALSGDVSAAPAAETNSGTSCAAAAWLDTVMSEDQWSEDARTACAVGTQFWPLGRAKTRVVVRSAYAQTVANLHIKLGTPLVPLPTF